MTPEERARRALQPGKKGPCSCFRESDVDRFLSTRCTDGLCKDAVDRVATAITEAVAAERAACAKIARTLEPDIGECHRAVMGHANTIADAIEARGKP